MNSLTARLLVAGLLVLFLFAALTGVALEIAAVRNAELAERDRLRGLVYGLLGAAEPVPGGGLTVPDPLLPEAKLRQPDSGLEAALWNAEGELIWQSPSVVGSSRWTSTAKVLPEVGTTLFGRVATAEGDELFRLSFGLSWLHEDEVAREYALVVSQDVGAFEARRSAFRNTLWLWLGVFTLGLLLLQWLVLRWGLRPLRRLDAEMSAIRKGGAEAVGGDYPNELKPLSDGLNALLAHERGQQTRYRNALADLAHSLKTPLAVLRGLPEERSAGGLTPELRRRLQDQVERMDQILAYQLGRAAAAGSRIWHGRVALRPQLERIAAALTKVYRNRAIDYELDVAADYSLPLEQGDLMEIFGNLMDNASKHCQARVRVAIGVADDEFIVHVDDDGTGFPTTSADMLLQRGVRQDARHDGQGMGLALVADIISAAGGAIELGRSDLGGARVSIRLPA